jgi:exonuclease III
MSTLIALIRDLKAFTKQLIPGPINLFRPYQFSPADLATIGLHDHDHGGGVASAALAVVDVLSYNVNNTAAECHHRRGRILRAIVSSDADVLLLQETNPAWEALLDGDAAIASRFAYRHFRHPGASDRAAGGIAVLSRHPLDDARVLEFAGDVPGSVFPALTFGVEIPIIRNESESVGGRPPDRFVATINVANVHFRPPLELDGSAWLDTARKTRPIRMGEARELIRRSAPDEARGTKRTNTHPPLGIIAGDFNEEDDSGALAYLASLGYVDALWQHVPRGKETHTWPFLGNLLLMRKRLDHILWHDGPLEVTSNEGERVEYSVKLKCLGCGVVTGFEDGASDHQPVLSRFAIVNG